MVSLIFTVALGTDTRVLTLQICSEVRITSRYLRDLRRWQGLLCVPESEDLAQPPWWWYLA